MRKKFYLRAFFILAVLTAGLWILANTRLSKTTEEEVCTESGDQCEKPQARGEFIILEALNRAVMVTAR